MHGPDSSYSRPTSPVATAAGIDRTSGTFDDLTLALASVSRGSSPEPLTATTCCCGHEECDNLKAWNHVKARLERRLTLSAEVGQALLKRYEAFVKDHETQLRNPPPPSDSESSTDDGYSTQEDMDNQLARLLSKNASLEKTLSQALVNNEVTEVSNKTILQELQEAKLTISRLSAHHARSVGWDNRLAAANKERDDMQQERDFESQRARLAESRFAALKDKTSKLQADVRRLQDDLQKKQTHRLESSESILQDARSQLQLFQQSLQSSSAATEEVELTKVLESLVDDNDALKRDNEELQRFLADSREELRTLQEEVEEQRLNPPSRVSAGTPHTPTFRQHFYTSSVPSVNLREIPGFKGRVPSAERKNRRGVGAEPLTPETANRPLSPTESFSFPAESKRASFSQPQPRYPTSPYEIELQEDSQGEDEDAVERPRNHKPLLLLNRSRGIQTDPDPSQGLLSPSPFPSHASGSSPSPIDPRSESSSFSESVAGTMSVLIDRVAALLTRLTQSDPLTLTNRLKRQHLRGADVGHLSRTTVSTILTDVASLRLQFRALLEDDKILTTCTRKDLRALFKLFRDLFGEMAQMRVTLNEVILDPSIAPSVREMAFNPSKGEADGDREKDSSSQAAGSGWMAPISKLFGAPGRSDHVGSPLGRSNSAKIASPRPTKFVPKLGPALSASATTVNVEFSGSGVGRAVTSTFSSFPGATGSPARSVSSSSGVMGIFAGAPAPLPRTGDSWVVLPKGLRRVSSVMQPVESGTPRRQLATAGLRSNPNRLSRNVDAVIDVTSPSYSGTGEEEDDQVGPLLQRTLRRRGLSDSSIHSTFMESAPEELPTEENAWPERSGGVLNNLSRKVQNFRLTASGAMTGLTSGSDAGTSPPASSTMSSRSGNEGTPSRSSAGGSGGGGGGLGGFLPVLSAWTAPLSGGIDSLPPEPFYIGSPRDESAMLSRTARDDPNRLAQGRGFY